MAGEKERRTPLWEPIHHAVYLRIAIIVASCLVLTTAIMSLRMALENDHSLEKRILYETYAATGELMLVALQTAILQLTAVILIKCAFFLLVRRVQVLLLVLDVTLSCVLLAGYTTGSIGAGVVAHKWSRESNDQLFKATAGITAFSSLLMVLVASLACWTLCALYSLKIATSNQQRHKKPTTPTLV